MKPATITILLMATCLFSEGADKTQRKQKDYPLALEIFETQSVETAHDLVLVKASDGNLYTISCPDSGGGLVALLLLNPHCSDVTLVPGTVYRARWNGGDLTVSVSADDKSGTHPREATFTVVHSKRMTPEETQGCKVCVLGAGSKENSVSVSQKAPELTIPGSSAAAADSVDDAVSDFHAWESKSECNQQIGYRQCVEQVEAAIPILQRLNLEWRALKREIRTESDDPRTPQTCRVTVSELTTAFDDYLLLQGKKVTMYESVDVDAPDAQIKWRMANAEYEELQRKEESTLSDLDLLYKRLTDACPPM